MSIDKIAKGWRRETDVRKEYFKKGYTVCYKPSRSRFNDNDVFNLFDLLLYNPISKELLMLSVKSNYGSKQHKKDLENFKVDKTKTGIVEYRGKRKGNERTIIY